MAESWALISSWTAPIPLFLLLNAVIGFIALISVFASRKNDHSQPPEHYHHQHYQIHHRDSAKTLLRAPSLFSRVASFNFSSHVYGSQSAFDDAAPLQEISPFIAPSLQINGSVEPETTIDEPQPAPIERAPSFLERMTSFNRVYISKSAEPETMTDELQPTPIERAPSFLERMASFNRVSVNKSAEQEPNPPQSERKLARAPSLLSQMSSFDFSFYRSKVSDPEPALVKAREPRVTRSTTEVKKKKRLPPTMKKSASEKIEKESDKASIGADEVDAKAEDFINRFKHQLRLQRLDSLLRYRTSAGEN